MVQLAIGVPQRKHQLGPGDVTGDPDDDAVNGPLALDLTQSRLRRPMCGRSARLATTPSTLGSISQSRARATSLV
jgi:hypothetical protein